MTISSVQFSHSVVSNSFWPPCSAAHQASLSITNSWSLLKLMFIESGMPSGHLILCCPLLLLPSIFPSIRVFSIGYSYALKGLPWWPSHKKPACNVGASGDIGSITGLGRSPGWGHDTHPSALAERIPWQDQSIGSQRVRHGWSDSIHTCMHTVKTWAQEPQFQRVPEKTKGKVFKASTFSLSGITCTVQLI